MRVCGIIKLLVVARTIKTLPLANFYFKRNQANNKKNIERKAQKLFFSPIYSHCIAGNFGVTGANAAGSARSDAKLNVQSR